jgi:ketosteroid isomerase-like protein
MKIRLLLTLVGLAFGFAVPALAFQGDLAGDVKDAVYVVPEGLFSGRQAIEKRYADVFQRWHPTNFIGQADQLNAIGNEAWAVGEWSCTLQGQNGSVQVKGYDPGIYVREGDTWKIRMSTFNVAPKRRASDWMRHT